ncbi:MAG: 2-C-methyl-D-erythritol 4-phosphate cytidylyltransferase [Oscillospiraceae bacterium]|jgi:2-C-methyl-D-erythritol 4-phosphate cytidylyltransferase|nr:2-C-methyl-D-erythritol 4-phosphate cytidylyltransferase [Oscillospiraceae bacterium]
MIFGAIVAGGIGTRMSISDIPKQFMMLGNKPIIIHTIEKFILCTKLDYIFVGVHKDWTAYMENLLDKYSLDRNKVFIAEGGKDRNSTIFNIISAIEKTHGESTDHIIVTHDCVRPFVSIRIINENIDCALKYGACNTAIHSVDTIVVSEDGDSISDIPDRRRMFLGQTPQSFNMSELKKLYSELTEEEKNILTDACKIFYLRNKPVKIVAGDISNIKITTVSDYKMAQAIVGGKLFD